MKQKSEKYLHSRYTQCGFFTAFAVKPLNKILNCYLAKLKCPDSAVTNPYTYTCFWLEMSNKDWQGAKDQCETDGGHLLTFPSADSSKWFRDKAAKLATKHPGMSLEMHTKLLQIFAAAAQN